MAHQKHKNARETPLVVVDRKSRSLNRGAARDEGAAMNLIALQVIIITLFSLPAFALVWIGFLRVADEFLIFFGHVPPLIMLLVIAICITPRNGRVVTGIVLACIYALCALFSWVINFIGVMTF